MSLSLEQIENEARQLTPQQQEELVIRLCGDRKQDFIKIYNLREKIQQAEQSFESGRSAEFDLEAIIEEAELKYRSGGNQ